MSITEEDIHVTVGEKDGRVVVTTTSATGFAHLHMEPEFALDHAERVRAEALRILARRNNAAPQQQQQQDDDERPHVAPKE